MKKILVIDDEKDFTQMVKLNLENTGNYEVFIENQASSAFETIRMVQPDLILLDVIMPGVEGPDILCGLKDSDHYKGIPVIFLTATVTSDEVNEQEGVIGGHEFLAKPARLDDLMACIDRHLDAGGNQPADHTPEA